MLCEVRLGQSVVVAPGALFTSAFSERDFALVHFTSEAASSGSRPSSAHAKTPLCSGARVARKAKGMRLLFGGIRRKRGERRRAV